MKIICTALAHGANPIHVYKQGSDNTLAIWHQDNLPQELWQELQQVHGQPDFLINSAHPTFDAGATEYYYWPDDILTISYFLDTIPNLDLPTERCFNFSINRSELSRHLLLKLVEWFDLKSYDYTWNGKSNAISLQGIGNDFPLLKESDVGVYSDFAKHVFAPIEKIQPRFIECNTTSMRAELVFWDQTLRHMFSRTAVSLISEPVWGKYNINFSEKTIFSIKAATFPIWIGGYRQAEFWEKHGFDIFGDVVNHDYQYCDTVLERCVKAFVDNMELLTNLELVNSLRQQHRDRFELNRREHTNRLRAQFISCWHRMPSLLKTHFLAYTDQLGPKWPLYKIVNLHDY